MQRVIIFGNSGAGKTTLAKAIGEEFNLATWTWIHWPGAIRHRRKDGLLLKVL